MDFRKATELFADPDFDGDPVQIYEPGPDDPPVPPDPPEEEPLPPDADPEPPIIGDPVPPDGKRVKYYVGDVEVTVVAERVQYYGKDGKLITESLKDYTQKNVKQEYASLEEFLNRWNKADQKQAVIQELQEQGVIFEALAEEVGKDLDPFDMICHVVFGQPPLTRRERAENVKKRNYFTKYGEQARNVLDALLDKYADTGIENIESMNVLKVQPLNKFGAPLEILDFFGGKEKYLQAVKELEEQLYAAA